MNLYKNTMNNTARTIFYYFCFLSCLFFCCGCGKKRPDGLGPTFPTTISVTKEGQPLANARIVLHSETGMNFSFAGVTNEEGKAAMISEFDYPGIPEGTYRVAIIKSPGADIPKKSQAEINAMSMEEGRAYVQGLGKAAKKGAKIIPDHLMVPSASPLRITVSSGENSFSFEIDEWKVPPADWKPPKNS